MSRARENNLKTSNVPVSCRGFEVVLCCAVFVYDATEGVQNVKSLSISIINNHAPVSASGSFANACLLNLIIDSGVIQLVDDSGGAFLTTTASVGTEQTLSNSQCTVLAGGSSVKTSTSSVTANVYLTFAESFHGAKKIYMSGQSHARIGAIGTQQKGMPSGLIMQRSIALRR